MNRGLKFTTLLALLGLALAACGGNPAASQNNPQPTDTEPAASQPPPTEASGAATETAPEPGGEAGTQSEAKTFTILPAETEARFIINEILFGNLAPVYGITNEVQGSITADYQNPAGASIGPITINLAALATDNPNRNRMLHNSILETGTYPTGTFEVSSISGLPETAAIGQAFSFQITGNLTVHGVSNELTFEATVTPVSETRLEGQASAQVVYQDFGINIFRLPPQVASVEDEVILEIEFAAESE